MAARRVLSVSLPSSDPHSAVVGAWLDAQPAGVDISREVRRLLAGALAADVRLAAIEGKLDRLLAGGALLAPAPPPAPLNDPETEAALEALFDFG